MRNNRNNVVYHTEKIEYEYVLVPHNADAVNYTDSNAECFKAAMQSKILLNPCTQHMLDMYANVAIKKWKWYFTLDCIAYAPDGKISLNKPWMNQKLALTTDDIAQVDEKEVDGRVIREAPKSKFVTVGNKKPVMFQYTPNYMFRQLFKCDKVKSIAGDNDLQLFYKNIYGSNNYRVPGYFYGSMGPLFKDADLARMFKTNIIGLRYVLRCSQYCTMMFHNKLNC